jgi:hypothetical protein
MKFNMLKTLATALSISALTAGTASAVIVGGIDFGSLVGGVGHLEQATVAETFISGNGQQLQGYGQVTNVNGDTTYCADGTSNCGLYFHLYNYTSTNYSPAGVNFTGGIVDVYYSANPLINLFSANSPANIAFIQSLTPWARLTGHANGGGNTLEAFGTLTGATVSFLGTGLLDVDLGGAFGLASVASFINGNAINDLAGGFADLALTSSGNNFLVNPNDICTKTPVSGGLAGQWCIQGNANLRGDAAVPGPAIPLLLGAGLLAFGVARRKAQ